VALIELDSQNIADAGVGVDGFGAIGDGSASLGVPDIDGAARQDDGARWRREINRGIGGGWRRSRLNPCHPGSAQHLACFGEPGAFPLLHEIYNIASLATAEALKPLQAGLAREDRKRRGFLSMERTASLPFLAVFRQFDAKSRDYCVKRIVPPDLVGIELHD
jgi:hypothetical protein